MRHTAKGIRAIFEGVRFKLNGQIARVLFYSETSDPNEIPWSRTLAIVFHDMIENSNTLGYNQRVILVSIRRGEEGCLYVRFERNVRCR